METIPRFIFPNDTREGNSVYEQKMFYLINNLSGEARVLVSHLTICDANYKVVWKILAKRLSNTRLLVKKKSNHSQQQRSQPHSKHQGTSRCDQRILTFVEGDEYQH
jgi:hypothetical protein